MPNLRNIPAPPSGQVIRQDRSDPSSWYSMQEMFDLTQFLYALSEEIDVVSRVESTPQAVKAVLYKVNNDFAALIGGLNHVIDPFKNHWETPHPSGVLVLQTYAETPTPEAAPDEEDRCLDSET